MKNTGLIAAILGVTGVGLGAFGAHGLKARLEAADASALWQTAVFYHLLHAVALLALAVAARPRFAVRAMTLLRLSGGCWIGGIIGFSGSLYILALGGPRWLGPVTPVGGLALIAGWACAGWALWVQDKSQDER